MMKNTFTAILGGLLAVAIAGCGKEPPPPTPNAPAKAPAAGAAQPSTPTAAAIDDPIVEGKARDVVCGDVVVAKGSKEFVYKNTRYHFCSDECLGKFKADPTKFDTGLPGESCVCKSGGMPDCKCGHCKGKSERCPCNDPEKDDKPAEGHDHDHH